jgi:cobyrinic acid a,c-diamide synthase
MAGVVPTDGRMTQRLALGYRHARATVASPLGPPGLELRGHEFHYSSVSPPDAALVNVDSTGPPISSWARPDLLASYLHLHLGATPELATAFVRAAAAG